MKPQPEYTIKIIQRARALRKAGWTQRKVAELIGKEFDITPPASSTIYLWCASETIRKKYYNRDKGRWRGDDPKPYANLTKGYKLARMHQLYDAGLSPWAVGVVAGIWWDEPLGQRAVEYRLGKGTAPKRGWQKGERRAA